MELAALLLWVANAFLIRFIALVGAILVKFLVKSWLKSRPSEVGLGTNLPKDFDAVSCVVDKHVNIV